MGVPVDSSTTAEDIIDFILDHNDIPLAYDKVCAIIVVNDDKQGYPVAPNTLMEQY